MTSEGSGGSHCGPMAEDAGRHGPAQRTAVLITGMHRNGTSALARTLSLLGASLPEDIVPANEGNPHGHWEPRAMVDLNDRMLAQAGSDLYSARDIDPVWFDSSAAAYFADEATRWVRDALGDERLVVLKDPRTALLAPIWNRALATAGFRVVHVLPLRHPAEVAESLRRRHLKTIPYDAWVKPRGEAVWLRYTLAAVRGSRGHPRAFLRYGDLLTDWRTEVARLGDELGIAWPGLGTVAEDRVDAFLHGNGHVSGDPRSDDPKGRDLRGLDLAGLAAVCYADLLSEGDQGQRMDAFHAEFTARIGGAGDLISTLEDLYSLVWRYFEESNAVRGRLHLSIAAEGRLRDKARQSWAALTEANGDKLRMLLDAGSRERQVVALRQEVARLEGLAEQATVRSTELDERLVELHGAHARLAAEHDASILAERGMVEVARRESGETEARLDAVSRSTSWRITAPMRALSRIVRGRS